MKNESAAPAKSGLRAESSALLTGVLVALWRDAQNPAFQVSLAFELLNPV